MECWGSNLSWLCVRQMPSSLCSCSSCWTLSSEHATFGHGPRLDYPLGVSILGHQSHHPKLISRSATGGPCIMLVLALWGISRAAGDLHFCIHGSIGGAHENGGSDSPLRDHLLLLHLLPSLSQFPKCQIPGQPRSHPRESQSGANYKEK